MANNFLPKNNRFVAANAAPNVPHCSNSISISKSNMPTLNHKLYITRLEGKTVKDRTIRAHIKCDNNPNSIFGSILVIMKKHEISEPIEHFRFGWASGPKDPPETIFDYNCATVDWEEMKIFTLIQYIDGSKNDEGKSTKSKSNKNNFF